MIMLMSVDCDFKIAELRTPHSRTKIMKLVDWFDRQFDFSKGENTMPSILERLDGTPIRLKEKIKNVELNRLTFQPMGKWSILEHLGHLSDLEPLWQGRLEDILTEKKELRATDLSNRQTTIAGHNNKTPQELLVAFETLRKTTVKLLKGLKDEDVFRSALHPRLQTPMRTIDLFLFVAEHDDHHLARMTEILEFNVQGSKF